MNDVVMNTGKVLGTRLMETLIIGAVVLFGVVQVLKSQTEAIVETQKQMITEMKSFGKEQSKRETIVYDSKEHMKNWKIHKVEK